MVGAIKPTESHKRASSFLMPAVLLSREKMWSLIAILVVTSFSVQSPGGRLSQGVSSWVGAYTYRESVGKEGSQEYQVDVCDATGFAYITVDGFKAETRLEARASEKNGQLQIYFESYGKDDLRKEGRQPGELLLTLTRRGTKYRIIWGSLRPNLSSNFAARVGRTRVKRIGTDCSATKVPEKWRIQ